MSDRSRPKKTFSTGPTTCYVRLEEETMIQRIQKSYRDASRFCPNVFSSPFATMMTGGFFSKQHRYQQESLSSRQQHQHQQRQFYTQKSINRPIKNLWCHQSFFSTFISDNDPSIDSERLDLIDEHDGSEGSQLGGDPKVTGQLYQPKPWFDKSRPLNVRIKELLDTRTIHPADIAHPMMEELIKECCYKNTIEGMQHGQEILDRCFVEKRRYQMTTEFKFFIPQKLLQILLFGWCKIAHKEVVAQARMKEIIQLAIEEGKMDDEFLHNRLNVPRTKRIASDVYPTVYLFNTYLIGLGNAAKITPQAALDSEAILFDMIEYNRVLGWHTKPNTRSYTHVIVAYANTKHVAAGRRAYKILQQMKSVHDAEKEVYEEKSGRLYDYTLLHNNKRRLVTPDAAAYTATLKALQISNRSQELVMDLLSEAVDAPGVLLDSMLFVVSIKSLASIIDHETHALKRIELASEAESILRTMIKYSTTKEFQKPKMNSSEVDESDEIQYETNDSPLYENEKNDGTTTSIVEPIHLQSVDKNNDDSYITTDVSPADDAQSKNDDDVVIGDETVDDIGSSQQQHQPNEENRKSLRYGYNACIYAWAQSFSYEGALQCEKLLQEMIDSDFVQPDATTFNTCLHAWSKSHKFHMDAGLRAIELLNRQIDLSAMDQIGDDVKPDFQTFTSCILVQSKSKDDNRVQIAFTLLQKLLSEIKLGNLSVTRNPTAPFSAVLTTIAHYKVPTNSSADGTTDGASEIDVFNSSIDTQTDPYSMAISIFDQVEKDVHGIRTTVDHHCVTAFFKCINAHGIPGSTERENTSRRVFQNTCQSGYVSRQVLKEFQNILGPAASTFPDLRSPPKFWSHNVPSQFR